MVNRLTGGDMWVHEDRVEAYLAAGHRLAAAPKPQKPVKREVQAAPNVKKSAKRGK